MLNIQTFFYVYTLTCINQLYVCTLLQYRNQCIHIIQLLPRTASILEWHSWSLLLAQIPHTAHYSHQLFLLLASFPHFRFLFVSLIKKRSSASFDLYWWSLDEGSRKLGKLCSVDVWLYWSRSSQIDQTLVADKENESCAEYLKRITTDWFSLKSA